MNDAILSPMPFVVGAPRSGTTLLRFMLDAHPDLAIPPETGFLAAAAFDGSGPRSPEALHAVVTNFPPDASAWADYGLDAAAYLEALRALEPFDAASGLRAFYQLYSLAHGKPRHGDKTPLYCQHLRTIGRLFPEARIVHVVRDGRDVALSLRGMWFAPSRDVPALASFWQSQVRAARADRLLVGGYLEVRYEHLVRDPETTLRTVCGFLELPFHEAMLRYWQGTPARLLEHRTRLGADGRVIVTHEQRLMQQRLTMEPPQPDRIERWRHDMTRDEQDAFWRVAGDTLCELGYQPHAMPV